MKTIRSLTCGARNLSWKDVKRRLLAPPVAKLSPLKAGTE